MKKYTTTIKDEVGLEAMREHGVAFSGCTRCQGTGTTATQQTCSCVTRNIFYACHNKFTECCAHTARISNVSLDRTSGARGKLMFSRKNEEFVADFIGIARRALGPDTYEFKLFSFHILLGAADSLMCRQTGLDKRAWGRLKEQIIHVVALAYRDIQPFALFPVPDYFGKKLATKVKPSIIPQLQRFIPVRPPLMAAC